MAKAYNQARGYIRDLPSSEGRPPFLIVCDVGYVIELYSEFTCTGGTYVRFPAPQNYRIHLEDLRDPDIRARLRTVWSDPLSLDPSQHAAEVTREVGDALARHATSLEADKHDTAAIALFLQRVLFTLFAEDVGLLPEQSFEKMLIQTKENPKGFPILVTTLWKDMASGVEYSTVLLREVAHFNGGLFENPSALPLSGEQIALLIHAAKKDWGNVEPAIFGTLLERALSKRERHKLGAHYTPRSYVERLVKPTVIDPLREKWNTVKIAVATNIEEAQRLRVEASDLASKSKHKLASKAALEAEKPEKACPQLIERAVAIAQLVLWIGYFQWHKKTTGSADTKDRPLLENEKNIVQQDAVLAYDAKTPRKRKVWKKDVPESADLVMFWWEKAAELLRAGKIQRFGFITTNSIHQTFNRVTKETDLEDGEQAVELQTQLGKIVANLKIGADMTSATQLQSKTREFINIY